MKGITVYRPQKTALYFEVGKEWEKKKNEVVKAITAYGESVRVDFLSGRHIEIMGMPYIWEYVPDEDVDVPF